MNKLKTLLTWGLLLAATHVMGYTITVDPIQIKAGQSTNLIINLTNTETNLTAYQMKLFLPEGVTVQKKSNGKYAYTANTDRVDPDLFTTTVKDAADGSVLIAVFAPDKDAIAGTSGELIRLPLDVASTVTASLQGSLKNIEFTTVQSQGQKHADVTFDLTLTAKEAQTLSLTALPEMTEGDAAYSLPQKTTQGLALTWSVADATIASISGNQLTPLTAGTTTVTATQAGNDNYLPFTKDFTLTVNERLADNNTISCSDITARSGQQVELPIMMTNNADNLFVGFQFTLTLPEGVTVALNAKGKPIFSFSSRIDAEEFLTNQVRKLSDNSWAFPIVGSGELGVIQGTEGEIMRITLEIADDLEDGNYDISLTNVKTNIRNDDFSVQTVNLSSSVSTLTINNIEMGDVNCDGNVDTSDAIMVIYHSLNLNPAHFLETVADMNGDGVIDTSDAIMIIYKSLGLLQK